jgi:uncharacterized protein with LGFP repeats
MTRAAYPSSTGTATTGPSDQRSAGERAQDAKDTAAHEGEHLKQSATEETKNVAHEAKEQARNVVDEAKTQLQEQSRTQRDQLAQTLRGFADDLDQMSSQAPGGLASDVTRQVAQKAHDLSSHLSGREPGQLLDDVRGYARRNPGKFLLGALAAGVVGGRLARGAKDEMSGSGQRSSGHQSSTTTLEPAGSTATAVQPPGTVGVQGAIPPQAEPVPGHTSTMPPPATLPRGDEPL